MEELIDKVRLALGPDRELDAEIECALSCPGYIESWPTPADGWCWTFDSDDDGSVNIFLTLGNKTSRKHKRYSAPHYTSSLDSAVSLVQPEHDWIVASVNGQVGGTPYACVGSEAHNYAETPALSLVLAALRARHTTPTSVGAA